MPAVAYRPSTRNAQMRAAAVLRGGQGRCTSRPARCHVSGPMFHISETLTLQKFRETSYSLGKSSADVVGYSDPESASPESASGSGPQSPAPSLRAHALSPAETNFISPSSDAAPPERVAFPRTRCLRLQAMVCSLQPARVHAARPLRRFLPSRPAYGVHSWRRAAE